MISKIMVQGQGNADGKLSVRKEDGFIMSIDAIFIFTGLVQPASPLICCFLQWMHILVEYSSGIIDVYIINFIAHV